MRQRVPWSLRRLREEFTAGNRVTLLRDGGEAFPAMLEAIRHAERQVLLEMYWFASDTIGNRFANALTAAVGRGVEVAVLYDAVGSWESNSVFKALKHGGVKVVEFNPLAPWKKRFRFDRLTVRDHRKILVVDGAVGFTGGINIGDEWLPEEENGGGWRDDMVRVEGPCAFELARCFVNTWQRQDGATLKALPERPQPARGGQHANVLAQNFLRMRREIVRAYLHQMYRARRRIWIANSYFLPDRRVVRALMRAAQRGVDVRVLVPGRSDVEIVRLASRHLWWRLLGHGVRLFEWHKSTLHTKSAVIDGIWSTTGTFNLDYRSIYSNLEVNVSVLDEEFAATMEASFLQDLSESVEVVTDDLRYRSLSDRVIEFLAYRFRKLL